MKLNRRSMVRLENLHRRLEAWLPPPHELPLLPKKLLLIRPTVRRDTFSRLSYRWAENVKTRALAEGWQVEDLGGERATRGNIEEALSLSRPVIQRPRLVMHYDHGSEFTLYGHAPRRGREAIDDFVAVIDEMNVEMTAGKFVSAAACLSAAGLGPLAIRAHANGYIGYSTRLAGSLTRPEDFGEAVNAPNYALLAGRSPAEAFRLGWQAWDELASRLGAEDTFSGWFDRALAEWNRDGFTLLPP